MTARAMSISLRAFVPMLLAGLGACANSASKSPAARAVTDLLVGPDLEVGLHGVRSDDTGWIHSRSPRGDTAARLARVAFWRIIEEHRNDALTKRLLCAALQIGVEDPWFHREAAHIFDSYYDDSVAVREVATAAALQWPDSTLQAGRWPRGLPTMVVRGSTLGPPVIADGCTAALLAGRG